MDTQTLVLIALIIPVSVAAASYGLIWRRRRRGATAAIAPDGTREVAIVVNGGYRPDVVRVRAGQQVRLLFRRFDADPCAAHVYFAEPPLSRHLAPHATTTVTITPCKVGTHLFTCEEGRYRGHLVVEPPEPTARRGAAGPSSQAASAA